MVKSILVALLVFCSFSSKAHEYFFAYAEVEYNELSQKLESSIVATTHDFELAMEDIGLTDKLEDVDNDNVQFKLIEKFINNHLQINSNKHHIYLNLIGIDVSLNGSVSFYLESNEVIINEGVQIFFDLLMNEFQDQQNKLSFIFRENTQTVTFLPHKKEHTLELSK